MKRRDFTFGACCCTASLSAGCVAHTSDGRPISEIDNLVPGQKVKEPDEAGLWLSVNKLEGRLKRSPERITDPAITHLIEDATCRLSRNYCQDLRPMVMRIPHFNASMYPTGLMQVWSGLLLRCQNESQLAAVLGHEFGHYLRRHSLQRIRDTKAKANFATFLSIGMAVAGLPPGFGDMMSLMVSASVSGFSRNNEREADALGIKVMAEAGYDPFEAPRIWERLIREQKGGDEDRSPNFFTDSHPDPSERIAKLTAAAQLIGKPTVAPPDRLRDALAPMRFLLLQDEVNLRNFKRSDALFDILLEDKHREGEVLFFKGELRRHRAKNDDDDKAVDLYHQSLKAEACPPESHRSAGLVHWKAGRAEKAAEHYRQYLDLKPDAKDAAIVRSYLEKM